MEKSTQISLQNIRLQNFRCFEQLEISFHQQLTVLVAPNGGGKTSILDALAIALGTFIGTFDRGKTTSIGSNDPRYARSHNLPQGERQYPVAIEASFLAPPITIRRELTGANNRTTIKDAAPLTNWGKQLQQKIQNHQQFSLPVIAYYGTGRLWKSHKNMARQEVLAASRTMGYEDCLSPASNFVQVQQWIAKATYAQVQESTAAKRGRDFTVPLQTIQNAVDRALASEGWQNFHYSFRYEELTMENAEGVLLPVSMLSDGLRSMVSLVADLAFRCACLNGFMGSGDPLASSGIVLIDEVDQHLHPAWQQRVIPSLLQVFPNVQFIVTTHSPQVLTTVNHQCIRILADGQAFAAPPGTAGAEPSRLLKQVLGLEDVRPQNIPATKELKEYLALVDQDQWSSPRALELRKALDDRYQGYEPELLEADLRIENRQWELEG
jgi:predicted ATP-binding protein involved in virulence